MNDAVPVKAVKTKEMYEWKQAEGTCGIEKMLEGNYDHIARAFSVTCIVAIV